MGILHFLDVGEGACSIIEHTSGRITTIDTCNARSTTRHTLLGPVRLPFVQLPRSECVNPVEYLEALGVDRIFRYIQTHPEMDHMDGIADLFDAFRPINFWDTTNNCEKNFEGVARYRAKDWRRYKSIRDGTAPDAPKRLVLYSGHEGRYWNWSDTLIEPHDNLHILAPTPALVREANRTGDYNDCSYVILWATNAGRVLFCGDSHDKTWEHILDTHENVVADVEVMIAPHHGRDSGRDRRFLDVVRPKLTLFGRAPSEYLAYDAWNNRGLPHFTNTQAGTVVVDALGTKLKVYVSKEQFARKWNPATYKDDLGAWYLGSI